MGLGKELKGVLMLDSVEGIRKWHSQVMELDEDQLLALKAGAVVTLLNVVFSEVDHWKDLADGKDVHELSVDVEITPLHKRRRVNGDDLI